MNDDSTTTRETIEETNCHSQSIVPTEELQVFLHYSAMNNGERLNPVTGVVGIVGEIKSSPPANTSHHLETSVDKHLLSMLLLLLLLFLFLLLLLSVLDHHHHHHHHHRSQFYSDTQEQTNA